MLLATHTDAMSLIEENGGLGMLGIMSYFNRVPKSDAAAHAHLLLRLPALHAGRRRPAGRSSTTTTIHPEKLKTIVATLGMEHMGGRQTIETGPGGNTYALLDARRRKTAASSPA